MVPTPLSTCYYYYYNCETPFALLFSSLRRQCPSPSTLHKARQLHALILTSTPSSSSPFLFNNLLSLYSKCGSLTDAHNLFDQMPHRNQVSFNTLVSSYSKTRSHSVVAFHIYQQMTLSGLNPNASTFSSLVQASVSLQDHRIGPAVHSKVVSSGYNSSLCVQTSLLGMYSQFGILQAADLVFGEMVERDAIAWNSMIFSSVKSGSVERGLQLFCSMVRTGLAPTASTLSIALSGCGRARDWVSGRIIHGHVIKSEFPPDVPLQNALLDMYSSCGDLDTAVLVFERIETPDLVSWNSVIAAFSDNGEGEKAMGAFIQLLRAMSQFGGPKPDEYTFAAVTTAVAALPSMWYGKPLHAQICKSGLEHSIYVGSTLMRMYFMNGEPDSARNLFSCIPERDAIMWTEMIVGHSRLGESELAMKYFYYLLEEGHKVDSFSLSSALSSSADLAALRQGEMIQSQVVKAGYEGNMCVSGSLIDMYAKNGNLEGSSSVFCMIEDPDLKCWNSMIGGYGNHGNAEQAFKFFGEMVERGLEPDHITYVSLLSACSHCGLVERGRFYWFCMMSDGMIPGLKHYTCMVSLLSRAGLLEEAEDTILRSPFADNSPELWRILLSSCIIFRNLDIGSYAAEKVLGLEPEDSSTHIMLSNLYASEGRWDAVAEIRRKIRALMLEKDPGLSWIEVKNTVHVFSADDECHSQIEDCRDELLRLQLNLIGREAHETVVKL